MFSTKRLYLICFFITVSNYSCLFSYIEPHDSSYLLHLAFILFFSSIAAIAYIKKDIFLRSICNKKTIRIIATSLVIFASSSAIFFVVKSQIITEIYSLYSFFITTPKESRAIVFYSEHSGYMPYFEGTINELVNKRKQIICYITSDAEDPILETNSTSIKSFYFNKLLPLVMKIIDCNVFVMTLTDLNQFYLKKSIYPVRYVYMFHSLVSTHLSYHKSAFDAYDVILCTSPYQIKEIRAREKQANLKAKKLVAGGYYRLERIIKNKKFAKKKSPATILIAPSWGPFNVLKTCGKEIISQLLSSGYKVIARPHPETGKRDKQLINSYKDFFCGNKNFTLETSVKTDDSLLAADLLITDLSGVALEYAFGLERPVIFIDLPYNEKNPDYKKLDIEPFEIAIRSKIGSLISLEQTQNIVPLIKKTLSNTKSLAKQIVNIKTESVFELGRSSAIAAQTIMEEKNNYES